VEDFVIFVRGTYRTEHLGFYRKLCRRRVKIAVNGGLRFFLKAQIAPDIVIGDFDSIQKTPKDLPHRVQVMAFPVRKDKSDLQLAFEYCLNHKAQSIDIVVPTFGQPDQFLGNVMLVRLVEELKHAGSCPRIRFVNVQYEIRFVKDHEEIFTNCIGDTVSVIPLSDSILLTCSGTEYDVQGVEISSGYTRGLSNRIVSRRAIFGIKGNAFVIHRTHT